MKHISHDFAYKSKNVDKLIFLIKNKRFLVLNFKTEPQCYSDSLFLIILKKDKRFLTKMSNKKIAEELSELAKVISDTHSINTKNEVLIQILMLCISEDWSTLKNAFPFIMKYADKSYKQSIADNTITVVFPSKKRNKIRGKEEI